MDESERKATLREAKILEVLNHPNIVGFKEVYKTKKGVLCIVMEYCDGGDLNTKIKEKNEKIRKTGNPEYFSEEQVLTWFTMICLSVKHVHDRKIIHRDLKTENIFMTKSGVCKLGDFGVSSVLKQTKDKAMTLAGTPYYVAPELYKDEPYSFEADIWSLGIILYELCDLDYPFHSEDGSQMMLAREVVKGKFKDIPDCYSDELRVLLKHLLNVDGKKRPNINQICAFPLIKEKIVQVLSMDSI